MDIKKLKQIGTSGRTKGINGELEILIHDENNFNPEEGDPVFFNIDNSSIPFFITYIKKEGNRYLVKLDDVDSQQQAQKLSNREIFIPEKKKNQNKNHGLQHVIGYKVIDTNLGEIGLVAVVHDFPAQQIIEIKNGVKEILLPATPHFLLEINHKDKIIRVTCPEGLLDVYK